jgi:PEP-CTERM motif
MPRFHMEVPAAMLVAGLAAVVPSVAHADFIGNFAPPNWTVTDTAGGSVNTSLAPASITLIDGADEIAGYTSYTLTVPYSVVVTFNWNYLNNDLYQDPLFEPAYYDVNGTLTELTNDLGSPTQNGTVTIALSAGELFGFEVSTFDGYYGGYNGSYGSAFLTISDLLVPEPASWPILVFGLGLLGLLARTGVTRFNHSF